MNRLQFDGQSWTFLVMSQKSSQYFAKMSNRIKWKRNGISHAKGQSSLSVFLFKFVDWMQGNWMCVKLFVLMYLVDDTLLCKWKLSPSVGVNENKESRGFILWVPWITGPKYLAIHPKDVQIQYFSLYQSGGLAHTALKTQIPIHRGAC